MEENVKFMSRDWKEQLDLRVFMQHVEFVQKFCNGTQANYDDGDAVRDGSDTIHTIIWPTHLELPDVDENTAWNLCRADKIHLSDDGKLFFQFQDGRWLDNSEAMALLG